MKFGLLGIIKSFRLLQDEFGSILTDEVIITDERAEHIRTKHPEDYDLFVQYSRAVISEPDYIVRDMKNIGTVFFVRHLPDTNLNVVVRLVLEGDNPEHKNSVMTFYRLRNKNLEKLISKNKLLYKNE